MNFESRISNNEMQGKKYDKDGTNKEKQAIQVAS